MELSKSPNLSKQQSKDLENNKLSFQELKKLEYTEGKKYHNFLVFNENLIVGKQNKEQESFILDVFLPNRSEKIIQSIEFENVYAFINLIVHTESSFIVAYKKSLNQRSSDFVSLFFFTVGSKSIQLEKEINVDPSHDFSVDSIFVLSPNFLSFYGYNQFRLQQELHIYDVQKNNFRRLQNFTSPKYRLDEIQEEDEVNGEVCNFEKSEAYDDSIYIIFQNDVKLVNWKKDIVTLILDPEKGSFDVIDFLRSYSNSRNEEIVLCFFCFNERIEIFNTSIIFQKHDKSKNFSVCKKIQTIQSYYVVSASKCIKSSVILCNRWKMERQKDSSLIVLFGLTDDTSKPIKEIGEILVGSDDAPVFNNFEITCFSSGRINEDYVDIIFQRLEGLPFTKEFGIWRISSKKKFLKVQFEEDDFFERIDYVKEKKNFFGFKVAFYCFFSVKLRNVELSLFQKFLLM